MLPHIARLLGSYLVVSILTFNADVGYNGTATNIIPFDRTSQNDIGLSVDSTNHTIFNREGAYLISTNLNIRITAPATYKSFNLIFGIQSPSFLYCSSFGSSGTCGGVVPYPSINDQLTATMITGASGAIYNLNGFAGLNMVLSPFTSLQLFISSNTSTTFDILAGSTMTISQYA